MNQMAISEELTLIGNYFSSQIRTIGEFKQIDNPFEDSLTIDFSKVDKLIDSFKTKKWYRFPDFLSSKEALLSYLQSIDESLQTKSDFIHLYSKLIDLTFQMQFVIHLTNKKMVWSKFMEFRNLLIFYSYHFHNQNSYFLPCGGETLQHLEKLKILIDAVLDYTSKKNQEIEILT